MLKDYKYPKHRLYVIKRMFFAMNISLYFFVQNYNNFVKFYCWYI